MPSVKATLDAFCPPFLLKYKTRIESSSLGYRLARGAFWSIAGAAISRGLGLLGTIIAARIIGKSAYGHLGMVQSTVGVFGILAGFGLGLTANKHVAQFRSTDPARAGRILGLSSLVSWGSGLAATLVMVLLAPWLSVRTLASPEMSGLLRVGSLLLLLGGVNGAQTGALSGFEAFKTVARVNLIAGLVSFPVMLLFTIFWGLNGAVSALVVNLAINCVLNFIALRREAARAGVPLGYRNCLREWPLLWKFSLPALLATALSGPVTWAASSFLVNQPDGYGAMGVYSAILRMRSIPEQVLYILLAPLLPVLTETLSRGDMRAFRKAAWAAFTLSLLLTGPYAVIQIALPQATLLPFGSAYAGNSAGVQWLMLDMAVVSFFMPLGGVMTSMNLMWFELGNNFFWSILYGVLCFVLIPKHSAAGLAAALTISHLAIIPPSLMILRRRRPALFSGLPLGKLFTLMCLLAGICFAAGTGGLLWGGVALVAVALLSVLLFNGGFFRLPEMADASPVVAREPEPEQVSV